MKSILRYAWPACAAAGVFVFTQAAPLANAQVADRVNKIEIRHVGPATASDTLIRSNIRIKEGEVFTQTSIDDDVRNLYSTGFFINVQIQRKAGTDGVTLVYELQGKPLLTTVKFAGNKKYKDKKLLKKVVSKTGQPMDEKKLFTDAQEIEKMYQKSGYPGTKVKYVPSIDEQAGRGTVTFEVTESPKVKIEKVEFVGAEAFPQKKLRKVVKTRKRWMFSWLTGSGRLKDDVLEDDKDKITDFYRNEGYIDFDLKELKIDTTGPKTAVVRFMVNEGKKYEVGGVNFKGNTVFTTNEIAKPLKMGLNKTFTPKGLTKDVETIRDLYGAKGYVDASVLPLKNANIERGTMDVTYQIEEDKKYYIEHVEIKGNSKTKDKVIRRELAVAPGEVFDTVRVKLSKQRLEGLNYFEKVDARPEPSDVKDHKNLVVGVDEKNTGNFMIGAGFSSVDSIVGFVELSQGNFDLFKPPRFEGAGQKFRLRASVGTVRQDYTMSFVEPWFLERKLALGVDLYHRRLDYQSLHNYWDERRTGARFSLTRALWGDNWVGSVDYTIENVGVLLNEELGSRMNRFWQEEEGYRIVSKVGGSISWDTRNSATAPTKGQKTQLRAEVAGGPFAGDSDYYKFILQSSRYIKGFAEGHLFEINAQFGGVEGLNGDKFVPMFDRFYLGGLYSLRGYDYRDVGPVLGQVDPNDPKKVNDPEPFGGKTYWYGSLEYSIPVIERVRFAMFYDIGMVYWNFMDFSKTQVLDTYNGNRFMLMSGNKFYNDNVGIGVRLNLPIGPLRFDFGVPMTSESWNDSSGKFQFGVGYTREF